LSIKYISDRKLPDKAIDLMDEAMSSVKLKSISKPVELDVLEKEIRTLKIELEAKKGERMSEDEIKKHQINNKENNVESIFITVLKELEEKIKQKEEEAKKVEKAWKDEKDILDKIRKDREKIDKLKQEAIIYERE
jgi:ATP-dependent Clp protease ATP-binding subunit ClpB